ncbi:MAG: RNA polymerase sigma factor [Acidimicrobiales bacterium]
MAVDANGDNESDGGHRSFELFFVAFEPVVRRVLVAGFGPEIGRDAAAEAFGWAWKTWPRASGLDNRAGYLYRVGANAAKSRLQADARVHPGWFEPASVELGRSIEPGLDAALASLSRRQFQVVVLVEGHGYSHAETAAFLGIARSSVQNHLERAMAKLREVLGVSHEA